MKFLVVILYLVFYGIAMAVKAARKADNSLEVKKMTEDAPDSLMSHMRRIQTEIKKHQQNLERVPTPAQESAGSRMRQRREAALRMPDQFVPPPPFTPSFQAQDPEDHPFVTASQTAALSLAQQRAAARSAVQDSGPSHAPHRAKHMKADAQQNSNRDAYKSKGGWVKGQWRMSPREMRRVFVLSEIWQPPVALRGEGSRDRA